jgi:hypothetical protein
MLKRLAAIFLLCCLSLTILGYQFIFEFHFQEVKAEMKQYLASNSHKDVQEFIIAITDSATLSQFQWEDETEFNLNGEMYDVLQKISKDNKLIIRCISDTKETALLKNFEQINRENNNPSKQKCASLIKLISTDFETVSSFNFSSTTIKSRKVFASYNSNITSRYSTILTPPPQVS